jgi:hypothetical protein
VIAVYSRGLAYIVFCVTRAASLFCLSTSAAIRAASASAGGTGAKLEAASRPAGLRDGAERKLAPSRGGAGEVAIAGAVLEAAAIAGEGLGAAAIAGEGLGAAAIAGEGLGAAAIAGEGLGAASRPAGLRDGAERKLAPSRGGAGEVAIAGEGTHPTPTAKTSPGTRCTNPFRHSEVMACRCTMRAEAGDATGSEG